MIPALSLAILNLNLPLAFCASLDLAQGKGAPTNQLAGSWIVGVQLQQVFCLR